MNLAPSIPENPEVNLIPMIDVVFLLLIFFMVSTSFIHEASLSVQLPTASSTPSEMEGVPVEIVVGADGRYFFGTQEVVGGTVSALQAALLTAADSDTDRVIVIRADARAEHQAVITVMDAAGRAGFTRISLVTAQADDG